MDINSSGSTEVVVSPDFLEQLCASEDATRVLCQILKQLEFFESEIKGSTANFCGVSLLIDNHITTSNLTTSRVSFYSLCL
jgi:hypothetical protein